MSKEDLEGSLMKANPGGELAPAEVVGRDRLIQRIWETLEKQSVILVSERRMGKSSVNKKMVREKPESLIAIYRDIEGIDHPLSFAETLYKDILEHLDLGRRWSRHLRRVFKDLAGIELGGLVKLPAAAAPNWRLLLENLFRDLGDARGKKLVLFWDELPYMLQKIQQAHGDTLAMDLLDVLRSLRQMHENLRMVYTGSIGLHHVTEKLRQSGHANDATNDMRTLEVPPLAFEDARYLAGELLRGEGLASNDPDRDATLIAKQVDSIPFYIHSVVSELKDRGDHCDPQRIMEVIDQALVDPQNRWHLRYYRERLDTIFGLRDLQPALAVLDEVCLENGPTDLRRLRQVILLAEGSNESGLSMTDEDLRRLLIALQQDHYLVQDAQDGSYTFRFPLIRRWWQIHRNLQQPAIHEAGGAL